MERPATLHEALIQRDHVIGLEAEVARAKWDLEDYKARAKQEYQDLADKYNLAVRDLEALRASTTVRAGRLVTAPMRVLKRAK